MREERNNGMTEKKRKKKDESRIIDLDAAREERGEVAPYIIRFKGLDFEIPGEAPWGVMDALWGEHSLDRKMVFFVRNVFGERYQEFLNLLPTPEEVGHVVAEVCDVYGLTEGPKPKKASPNGKSKTQGSSDLE